MPPFPKRTIHLDFHTGPAIPDVGRDFDAEAFADAFAEARVDSVTLFGHCHHGHLYYDTPRPERHPGLRPGLNLLGEQIEALHARGIRAPIYMSVQCNEFAANAHPEWVSLSPEGKRYKWGEHLGPGWQIMDMSSPYQDYLAELIADVLERFSPIDGMFLDMCWDQVSCSKWAIDGIRRLGYNPHDAADRDRYSREVAYGYMARYKEMIDSAHKKNEPTYIWFNSRPKMNLHIEKKFLRHVEVECLPTGGWGYAYFPYVARYVRPFGLPTLSHTGRFHKSWGDFGGVKPDAALKYECCLILSQGLTGGIGDQLHPRGVPDPAAYEAIGKAYRYIEKCEPWVDGAKVLSQIAVVINPELGDQPGPDGLGVIRALQQLRHQFDLVRPETDLKGYELVVVPETVRIDSALRKNLGAYLKAAGALLVSGRAALEADGKPAMDELGIVAHGPSPYSVTYLRPAKAVAAGMPSSDAVMYEPGFRMTAQRGAKTLCQVVEPYFERAFEHFCSHRQTPADAVSRWAAVVENGRVATFSMPIFEAYGKNGNLPYRQLLANCIARLLPEPLIRDAGPAHLETSVLRKGSRTIVHLISYCPTRRTADLDIVEDPTPLIDVPIEVKTPRAPKRVVLAPEGLEVPFEYAGGYAKVRVTVLDGHAMLVLE